MEGRRLRTSQLDERGRRGDIRKLQHLSERNFHLTRKQTYSSLVPDMARLLPPEVASGSWDSIKRHPLPAIDSYGYGLLVYEAFSGSSAIPEQAAQGKGIPRSLQPAYKRLLNPSPKARLSTAHFLEQGRRNGGFFQTPLINLSEGIEGLGLMSEGERDEFFR